MNLSTCVIAAPNASEGIQIAALVTPAIGFLGVIIALIWSAWLSRRELRAKDDREARILRAALLAALRNMYRVIVEEINFIRDPVNNFTWVPLIDFFIIYRENLSKIGLLSTEEVNTMADIYFSYEKHASFIAKYADAPIDRRIGVPVEVKFENGKEKNKLLQDLNPLVPQIEAALRALGGDDAVAVARASL